jgi:hypothetical protein
MHLTVHEDGIVTLTLEAAEQVMVNIGGADLWCTGGLVNNPGEGPLIQILLQDATALEVKRWTPRVGNEYYDVRVVPVRPDEEP